MIHLLIGSSIFIIVVWLIWESSFFFTHGLHKPEHIDIRNYTRFNSIDRSMLINEKEVSYICPLHSVFFSYVVDYNGLIIRGSRKHRLIKKKYKQLRKHERTPNYR